PPGIENPARRGRPLDRTLSRRDREPRPPPRSRRRGVGLIAPADMPITLSTRDAGFEAGFQALLAGKRESAADVDAAVAAIIEDVAARGDAAVLDYTR